MRANKPGRPLKTRQAERQLFFWTARETLKLAMRAALTAYVLVSLVQDRIPSDIAGVVSNVVKVLR